MAFSRTKRIQTGLRVADLVIVVAWCVVAFFFPDDLFSTQGYVTAVAWYIGILLVGGQNPTYLYPRYRILVSMGLSLGLAALAGILWAGFARGGWSWYMQGGLLSLGAVGVAGLLARLAASIVLARPAVQIIPCRLPEEYLPLLAELSRHPHVRVEEILDDPAAPLPPRQPGYSIYLATTDLRLRDGDPATFMPLFARVETADICALYESLLGKVALVRGADGGWRLPHGLHAVSPVRERTKRFSDILLVLLTAPVTLPLVGMAALLMKLTSPGPAFFTQQRLGRHGHVFTLWKIRTMVAGAEAGGPRWAAARDVRVTPVGALLRRTGIDELPQLWNILRGEMSLVGPRPEVPEIAADLEADLPLFRARLLATPGLTGWAQLHQGGDQTTHDSSNKLRYDIYYLQYGNIALDFQILLGTLQMCFHLAKPAPRGRTEGRGLRTEDGERSTTV